MRNLLANVQALACRCAGISASPDEFSGRFGTRLEALARAADLLTERPGEDIPFRRGFGSERAALEAQEAR